MVSFDPGIGRIDAGWLGFLLWGGGGSRSRRSRCDTRIGGVDDDEVDPPILGAAASRLIGSHWLTFTESLRVQP